jgi:hypothetical protein
MEWIAYASQPPTEAVETRTDGMNTAGWATLLWISVLAVVFFLLLTAATLGLLRRRARD